MNIALHHLVVHQPIDDVGAFPLGRAEHGGVPQQVALVTEGVGGYALIFAEIFERDAWAMLKRRLRDAGLSTIYSNHSFRAAGITNYLENDGTLEVAQRIAGHADSRTTKLYDRRGQKVLLEDMERIRY
jgi:integrase